MRVAGFMSGSGTNIEKLIELQGKLAEARGQSPFELAFIFSDRSDGKSRGEFLAREAGIPYFSYDVRRFHELKGASRSVRTEAGMRLREEYDKVAARLIKAFGVDLIALGGYMSFLTLTGCVNVHPADLSLVDDQAQRVFVGDDAVYDAILAGQKELRSSTILTDLGVDSGPLLMLSEPIPVELEVDLETLKSRPKTLRLIADEHQERLKEAGDWVVFPKTIQFIAEGRFGLDEDDRVYFDGKPVPGGVKL